jgi:hypothetical protein
MPKESPPTGAVALLFTPFSRACARLDVERSNASGALNATARRSGGSRLLTPDCTLPPSQGILLPLEWHFTPAQAALRRDESTVYCVRSALSAFWLMTHIPHERLAEFSHFRMSPGDSWASAQEVQYLQFGKRTEWCGNDQQGASIHVDPDQRRRIDARPIMPGIQPTVLFNSGGLRCPKFQEPARARAESGLVPLAGYALDGRHDQAAALTCGRAATTQSRGGAQWPTSTTPRSSASDGLRRMVTSMTCTPPWLAT